ncbi:hypothetical protein [Deinococcus sp.]|uniref:hypothetical protein n=1 Tax=Deinococcus sp. TaxID=47478 RepID=UPI0025FA6ECD|nr:hypothetical protein [Deinococcus sp.]
MRAPVLLCALALLLAACSQKPLEQLRGQVRDWPGGAGSVSVLDEQNRTLTSTAIDPVGRFTLPLPGGDQMKPLLRPDGLQASFNLPGVGCTGRLLPSSPAARFFTLGALSAAPASGPALQLLSQNPGSRQGDPVRLDRRTLIYASESSRVQGELTCPLPAGPLTVSYSLNLKTGWNYAVTHRADYASGQKQRVVESVGKEGFEGWTVAPGNTALEP